MLNGLFCICLLGPSGLQYCSNPLFPLILCLNDLSTDETGVEKSPTIIVLLFIFPFSFVSISFIYWGALILVAWSPFHLSDLAVYVRAMLLSAYID